MNKVFGLGFTGLSYTRRLKRRMFYCLTIAVILLNIFFSATLNLKKARDFSFSNLFFVIDLQNNLDEKNKNDLEIEILKIPGIKQIRYVSKEESFKHLQEELNISIPGKDNPLSDSMVISIENISYLKEIETKLENNQKVQMVFKDDDFIKSEETKGNLYEILMYGSLASTVISFLLILYLFYITLSVDFFNCISSCEDSCDNIKMSKRKNLMTFLLSTLLGTLLFFHLYMYLSSVISKIEGYYLLVGYRTTILYHLGLIGLLNLIFFILPASILKIDDNRPNNNDDFDYDDFDYEEIEEESLEEEMDDDIYSDEIDEEMDEVIDEEEEIIRNKNSKGYGDYNESDYEAQKRIQREINEETDDDD